MSGIGRRHLLAGALAAAAFHPLQALAAAPGKAGLPAASGGTAGVGELFGGAFGLIPGSPADQSVRLQQAVDAAAAQGLALVLGGGVYRASGVRLASGTTIIGTGGAARIVATGAAPIFSAAGAVGLTLDGIGLDGDAGGPADDRSGLIALSKCENLLLTRIGVGNGAGNGIFLDGCSGRVAGATMTSHGGAGLFAVNSHDLVVTGNAVADCGNAGMLIWQDSSGPDGTIVTGNHVARIAARSGGSGQNGNGIDVFRADDVLVADNVISACAFSAVRANATRNVQIRGNACTALGEVAIYSEFAFSGSVIANNIVDGAAAGISMTNLDQGGALAVCTGNMVRNIAQISPGGPSARSYGIYAEADTTITGNTVSGVAGTGIAAGIGTYLRNVLIADNLIANADTGIAVSVADGAGLVKIANNLIAGARVNAIAGMRWAAVASPDLVANAGDFPNVSIAGNTVSP